MQQAFDKLAAEAVRGKPSKLGAGHDCSPSLSSIVESFKREGNEDRAMLLALLQAKKAEDEVCTSPFCLWTDFDNFGYSEIDSFELCLGCPSAISSCCESRVYFRNTRTCDRQVSLVALSLETVSHARYFRTHALYRIFCRLIPSIGSLFSLRQRVCCDNGLFWPGEVIFAPSQAQLSKTQIILRTGPRLYPTVPRYGYVRLARQARCTLTRICITIFTFSSSTTC